MEILKKGTKKSENVCPECGEPAKVRCRCPRSDSRCENGHKWHKCFVHHRVVPGHSDHSKPMNECTCPEEIRLEEDIVSLVDNGSKEDFKYCPICGKEATIRCKCPRCDSTCPEGHQWYLCPVHQTRVIGKSDHSKPTDECCCVTEAPVELPETTVFLSDEVRLAKVEARLVEIMYLLLQEHLPHGHLEELVSFVVSLDLNDVDSVQEFHHKRILQIAQELTHRIIKQ